MISVQRWLTKTNRCFDLLAASAEQARASVKCLAAATRAGGAGGSLAELGRCRKEHKRLTRELTSHLCVTFVTPLEREDIEELSTTLNRVSKAAEKFVERFQLAPQHVRGWDLSRQLGMLEEAADLQADIVRELCGGARLATLRELNARLQRIEADADRLLEASFQAFYGADEGSVQWVVRKDLTEQLEKVFDRCRSVGNVAYWTVLKNT